MAGCLDGVNLVLLGDNTGINVSVASLTAPLLGYSLVHTKEVIQKLKRQTVEQLIEADGESEFGKTL